VSSMASRVASVSSSCAVRSASSIQMLPGSPSSMFSLAITAMRSPTTSRTRRAISRTNRDRLSMLPPYSSRRRLISGLRNELGRYRWPKCSSTASNPASTATWAAAPNWSTTARISSRRISRQKASEVGLTNRLGATGVTPVSFFGATTPA